FYAKDAFAGLHTMDELTGGAIREKSSSSIEAAASDNGNRATDDAEDLVGEDAKLGIRKQARPRAVAKVSGDTTHTTRSDVNPNAPIPRAPFYGSRVVDEIPLDEVFAFVNETALFKGQWQFQQG